MPRPQLGHHDEINGNESLLDLDEVSIDESVPVHEQVNVDNNLQMLRESMPMRISWSLRVIRKINMSR